MNRKQEMENAQKEAFALNMQNLREFLTMYASLTERCFCNCAVLQHSSKLSAQEKLCVENCTDRYISYNQRLMPTFAEHYQAKMKEAEKAAIEQMEKAKQEQAAKEQTPPT